jgi:hypothetical protein
MGFLGEVRGRGLVVQEDFLHPEELLCYWRIFERKDDESAAGSYGEWGDGSVKTNKIKKKLLDYWVP